MAHISPFCGDWQVESAAFSAPPYNLSQPSLISQTLVGALSEISSSISLPYTTMPRRTPRLVITFLLTLRIGKEKNTPILRFACIFSNAAYMGFPLIQALFGAEGLLYASAYVTVFNILLWTVGYAMVSGKVRPGEVLHSILTTPVLWSVLLGLTLYLFRVNVPELIRQPLQLVGNMNTPLSMIITGMLIVGSKPEKPLGNREIYRIILIRMLFFRLLSVQGMVAEVVLLLEACPCAAITSVFAVQFGYDEDLAAGSVVITTFISIVVLPLCAMALTMMM